MADKSASTLRVLQSDNKKVKCDVEDCFNRRHGMGKLCTKHRQRLNTTGSVNQRSLKYKVFHHEIEEVRQLFTDMPDHPALLAVVKWLKTWMHDAVHKPESTESGFRIRVPGKVYVRRLADSKADPLEMLTQICGFWRYSQKHPDKYDTRHSYVQGLGTAMLHVLPMPSKDGCIPKSARTEAGEHIFQALLPLLVRVNGVCSKRVGQQKVQQDVLRTSWD
jgi:hypothetical protein